MARIPTACAENGTLPRSHSRAARWGRQCAPTFQARVRDGPWLAPGYAVQKATQLGVDPETN